MAHPMTILKDNIRNLLEASRRENPDAPYNEVVASSAVFHPVSELQSITGSENSPTKQYRLLLIQRAANEPLCPNVWELPGGQAESSDKTIQDAVFRELKEETGLLGVSIKGALTKAVFEYNEENDFAVGDEVTIRSIQLTYIVEVENNSTEVVLNPEEHQRSGWFTNDQAATLDITTGTRKIVEDAFLNGPRFL